jgi:hypothetical protein
MLAIRQAARRMCRQHVVLCLNQQQQRAVSTAEQQTSKDENIVSSFLRDMYKAVLPENTNQTSIPGSIRGGSLRAGDIQTSSVTDVMHVGTTDKKKDVNDFFRTLLRNNPVFQRVNEKVADMHEKYWETSDSPLVHRIQDAIDDSSLMQESEAQMATREMRSRDPAFDMVAFLRGLKEDVPIVIQGYLNGDEEVIKEYCSSEMIERLTGIMKAQKEAGLVPDPTLLDTSEVELVDLKMLDDSPIIVVQFTCQQINCTRDTHGNVVEGGPEDVQRVYYYWALQQGDAGFVGVDGKHHPPRWHLREMLIRGMHNLL